MNKLALNIDGKNIPNLPEFGTNSELKELTLGGIASVALNLIFYIAGLLLAIWLVWGVMQYIFAGGNKEALAKARSRITYALVGFIIVVMSFTISQYIKAALTFNPTRLLPPITNISTP